MQGTGSDKTGVWFRCFNMACSLAGVALPVFAISRSIHSCMYYRSLITLLMDYLHKMKDRVLSFRRKSMCRTEMNYSSTSQPAWTLPAPLFKSRNGLFINSVHSTVAREGVIHKHKATVHVSLQVDMQCVWVE